MNKEKANIDIISNSAKETMEIARLLGGKLKQGDILALSGELGSGKTCFTGGIARGLGVSESYQINSPTFTLINEYPGRHRLYHFDVYRLNGYAEFEDLGYEEYFSGEGVVVIEWAEKVAQVLPRNTFFVNFEYVDENIRKIKIKGLKSRLKELAIDLETEVG
jgi:tRNA threonylcarbamoyladenosine biosynthesis protein TsaE